MKKVFLVLVVLFGLAGICFADVTAEIIGKSIDDNGNIVVKTQYKIDGVEVQSKYPQEKGKYYWVTRYSMQNFYGMTDEEIIARIKQDISAFAKSLIQKVVIKAENSKMTLDGVVGTKVTETTAEIKISDTQKIEVKTDGTITEKAVAP